MPAFTAAFIQEIFHDGLFTVVVSTDFGLFEAVNFFNIAGISLTVSLPKYSSFTVITGAILQAPIQLTTSIENFLSLEVSPALIFNVLSIAYRILEEFLTWQAVPRHTFITFSPNGINLNWL